MQILKVWDGEYPWDVRAEKICRALTDGGHAVSMVARNRDGRVEREQLSECTVHRLAPWRLLGRGIDAASQFPAPMNPRWFRLMLRVARREGCRSILVRDLPLAPLAVAVGRLLGIPVVLDMAENYPAMIRDLWTTRSTRFGDSLVRNPRAVEAVERWTVARVAHILVVVEESRDRLVSEHGVPPERITVVGNTPPLERLRLGVPDPGQAPEAAAGPRALDLVYLGLLEKARGVGTVISAVALCRDRGVPIRFTVIGDGRARGEFAALRDRHGLGDDAVRMLGFLPYDDALGLVAWADAGIIPHFASESWNTTVPNKLFDYMAAGLCVITSDAKPARRIVEETGAGLAFESGNVEALSRVLERAWHARGDASRGQRGAAAIRERYHWELDAARLSGVFAALS